MLVQKILEEINQVFPKLGETQIIHDLDIAQKDFVVETDYLEDYASLSNPSTNCSWALPSDYRKFKSVLVYDSSGNPLYLEDYDIAYEIELGNIYFYSTNSTPISVMPSAIAYLFLVYYKEASDLTTPASVFEVNDEHLKGVYAKVYKEYFAKYPTDVVTATGTIISTINPTISNLWERTETQYRIKAKKYINLKNDTSDGHAIYQEAGKWLFPKRIKSLSGSTTPVSTSASGNVKEANYIITPSGVTQVGDLVGFSSMTATLDLPNNRVTFTGDVSAYTDFTSNNKGWEVHSYVEGVSYTVEWSDGITGIIVATIFEKVEH